MNGRYLARVGLGGSVGLGFRFGSVRTLASASALALAAASALALASASARALASASAFKRTSTSLLCGPLPGACDPTGGRAACCCDCPVDVGFGCAVGAGPAGNAPAGAAWPPDATVGDAAAGWAAGPVPDLVPGGAPPGGGNGAAVGAAG
jgi:hypothetical protein